MLIEFVAFVGILAIILIVLAELTKLNGIGLIAGVFLLFLAYWIYAGGIQYNSGTQITSVFNSTTNTTIQTTIPSAIELPTTPFYDLKILIAFSCVLGGLYVIVHYAMDIVQGG